MLFTMKAYDTKIVMLNYIILATQENAGNNATQTQNVLLHRLILAKTFSNLNQ